MGKGVKIGIDSCVNKGDKIGIIIFGDMCHGREGDM